MNDNAATVVLKELDLAQRAKVPAQKGEPETYDIFGLSDWSTDSCRNPIGDLCGTKAVMQRLVFKSNSVENQNMPLSVKTSLLRKY